LPNYTYATLTEALTELSARLYDPTNQLWTTTELTGYIVEALRNWNAITGFWRTEQSFLLALNTWWYDLSTVSGSVRPYTVTQYDIITQIENHLLEPPTPSSWTGSAQFGLTQVNNACQRRQDDILGETACTLVRALTATAAPRTTLADTVIDIRRVSWMPSTTYKVKTLNQSDFYAERAFNPGYSPGNNNTVPSNWMQNTEPPPSFDVDTPSLPVSGNWETLTVNSGPAWTAGANATLNIPDDWTWAIKWGALMDLLSTESNAKDAFRADYCMRRYKEAAALLENAAVTLAVKVNNVPLAVDAVNMADKYNPLWQAMNAGPPLNAYTAANLLGINPQPDSSSAYTAKVSVVQNAPVPAVGGDFIQVARDDFDTILDMAQHLAMFKVGGAEFAATVALYQGFLRKAALYNGKLKEMGFFELPQQEYATDEERSNARYSPGTGPNAS